MKYYYNGELIRTSKNHIYTHAVIDISCMRLLGCRGSKEKAESLRTTEINTVVRHLENCKNKLSALKAGKSKYGWKDRGKVWYENFSSKDTEESIQESIDYLEEKLERINRDYQVVELETRE